MAWARAALHRHLSSRGGRLSRRQDRPHRRVTVVTGEMFAPLLGGLLADLAVPGLEVELAPIANECSVAASAWRVS